MTSIALSPALLFQLSTKVHRAPDKLDPTSDWTLDDKYLLPRFDQWSGRADVKDKIDVRMAWSTAGLYFATSIICTARRAAKGTRQLELFIDTRSAIANRRLTKYCHSIRYTRRESTTLIDVACDATNDQYYPDSEKSKRVTEHSSMGDNAKEFSVRSFIPREVLYGYLPREFPQISYSFVYAHDDETVFTASLDRTMRQSNDPSLWIRGRLIDSE
jgi:hypothetical protein